MLILTTFMFWTVYHAAEEEASWQRMEIYLLLNHNTFAWTTSCVVNILQYVLHMFSEDSSSWIVVTSTTDSWLCLMPILALRRSYHSCAYCMLRQPSGSFWGSAQPTLQTAQGMWASPYAYLNALLKASSSSAKEWTDQRDSLSVWIQTETSLDASRLDPSLTTQNWNVMHFWVFSTLFLLADIRFIFFMTTFLHWKQLEHKHVCE